MNRAALVVSLIFVASACAPKQDPEQDGDKASAKPSTEAPAKRPASDATQPLETDTAITPDGEPVAEQPAVEQPETPPPTEPEPSTPEAEPAVPGEVAINPWKSTPLTRAWTLVAEPSEALTLVDLNAGVLGQAGSAWLQFGEDGALVTVEMDGEPKPPILGVWPSDAWFVDQRWRKYDEGDPEQEYLEIRLMKLRGGKRWVPQVYPPVGEQWFHVGTDEVLEPHMSTRSGMLVYGTFDDITRVAGSYDDPQIGAHRGEVVGFIESGAGKIYVISRDADGFYVQIECEDDACVAEQAKKLPLPEWSFGRQAPRGRHAASVVASSGAREFILHYRGKSEGWLLDELPAGGRPTGMWASKEGGLWTLTGSALRWRDAESGWHEVALPEGMSSPSVAITEDRQRVIVSGLVGGAPKLFATHANAEASAQAPSP